MTGKSPAESEASRPAKSSVLAAYADGVAAIGNSGSQISNWGAETPCGSWTTLDLAGHLLAIVRYYHRLLDACSEGRPIAGLPRGGDLAEMNATDLATLEVESGPERIETFVELAEIHLRRLHEANWDTTLGIWAGLGPLTVGEHTGIAIGEWHVHAWDLARASGSDHVPADPATVREGQHVLKRATDPGDPWTAVLRGYERDPGWAPSADAYFQRMPTGEISTDDPRTHDVLDLLERHLAFANTHSPPEDVHALAVSGLVDPAVTFFSSRADGKLLGVGAIRELDSQHCELKSMHTAAEARGQGIGRQMVDHLIAVARERGFRRVSIETGTMEAFAPARSLYLSSGFVPCEPFGEYTNSPNSICMTLWLESPGG